MAPPPRRPVGGGLALVATALFGGGMLGGNALVLASSATADGALRAGAAVTGAGTYRLSAIATALSAAGVLLLVAAARPTSNDVPQQEIGGAAGGTVAVAAAGAAGAALLLLAGLRYAGPDVAPTADGSEADLLAAMASACSFAAFVALGIALIARPGPAGAVRVLGRVAGACCALGPLAAAAAGAADTGAGYGVALASTAVGVLLVVGWGASLAVRGRRS